MVSITTTAYDTVVSWQEKDNDGVNKTFRDPYDHNTLEGEVLEVQPDVLVLRTEYRSKIYEYSVNPAQIVWVLKTALSEAGKQASERMRERHAEKTK